MDYSKMIFFNEEWNTTNEALSQERLRELQLTELEAIKNHKTHSTWEMMIQIAKMEGVSNCVFASELKDK
jgi:hypothetical protein